MISNTIGARIAAIDWREVARRLSEEGYAPLGRLLSESECDDLAAEFINDGAFRSRVEMNNHGFGSGRYAYFADPPPEIVAALRHGLYERLLEAANAWRAAMGEEGAYPASLEDYRALCAAAGQSKPTPLLLSYGPGDYNRLHQDLYGPEIFPFQVVILLSEPGRDFEGGEFVLTEQRARMQSKANVIQLAKGAATVFAVNFLPLRSARGVSRARLRHGVSTVRSGRRMALGVIFHNAG